MAMEIERKFLVVNADWKLGEGVRIWQGYLNHDKNRTVRVRVAGEEAYITVKGLTKGASRAEFEYQIPKMDAEQMRSLCIGPVIEKIRRIVIHEGSTWEVDEFLGDNEGLFVAEIELRSEDEIFQRPAWLGKEVTFESMYFNSNLARRPHKHWLNVLSRWLKGGP